MDSTGLAVCLIVLLASCVKEPGADPSRRPDTQYQPQLSTAHFIAGGDLHNQFVHLETGKVYIYQGETDEGNERLEISRLTDTLSIDGIACVLIREKVWIDGLLHEQVITYIAEDVTGDVWNLGVTAENYNASGSLINTNGSWFAGTDGAKPGIAMLSQPIIGNAYRQEYYFNIAENQAEVLDTGITVTTVFGTFQHCVVIKEWSELEPHIFDLKMYAPGVGLVKELNLSTGNETELIDIK